MIYTQKICDILDSEEYQRIFKIYDNKKTERSRVPLINHINEGLMILENIGASDEAMKAFCIHPIVQGDIEDCSWSSVNSLAQEYATKANSYLCRPENDWITCCFDAEQIIGRMSKNCRDMLLADKLQNRADFYKYHYGKHERSQELDMYFGNWIGYLNNVSLWKSPYNDGA